MVLRLKDSENLKWQKDMLSKQSILYSKYCFIKSNILKDMEQLSKSQNFKERDIPPRALELTLSSGQAIDREDLLRRF